MSAWLQRARASVVGYCAACGGSDVLSGDERTLINRALHLINELDDIEKAATVENNDRKHYFSTAGELRFVLGVIAKRWAKVAA